MAIPKHQEFRIPILNLLKDGKQLAIQEFVEPMALQFQITEEERAAVYNNCLLYTSPSPRDATLSRMPSSA